VSRTNGQSAFGQLRQQCVGDPRYDDHAPTAHFLGTWYVRKEVSRRGRSLGLCPRRCSCPQIMLVGCWAWDWRPMIIGGNDKCRRALLICICRLLILTKRSLGRTRSPTLSPLYPRVWWIVTAFRIPCSSDVGRGPVSIDEACSLSYCVSSNSSISLYGLRVLLYLTPKLLFGFEPESSEDP